MELDVLTMPREQAREAFLDYRRAAREARDSESRKQDEAMMRAYREAARGTPLIRLSDAIARGGTTTLEIPRWRYKKGAGQVRDGVNVVTLPRLAITNADATRCWSIGVRRNGSLELRDKRDIHTTNRRNRFDFEPGTFAEHEGYADDISWQPRIRAIVPTIPPALRPKSALKNYCILFEAEWGLDPQPPVDPALLKHVGGDLYAVLAAWDLTPIERAVLAGEDLRPER